MTDCGYLPSVLQSAMGAMGSMASMSFIIPMLPIIPIPGIVNPEVGYAHTSMLYTSRATIL